MCVCGVCVYVGEVLHTGMPVSLSLSLCNTHHTCVCLVNVGVVLHMRKPVSLSLSLCDTHHRTTHVCVRGECGGGTSDREACIRSFCLTLINGSNRIRGHCLL